MAETLHQTTENKIDARKMREEFEQNNEHRDYSIYTGAMRAATEAKVQSIAQYIDEVEEGSVIVDKGSGTGDVAEEMARQFRGAKVWGLDISHELLEQAEEDRRLLHLKYGNLVEQNFPDNSVDVQYFGTVGHEVVSFGGGIDAMKQALSIAHQEAAPGGQVILRDFRMPDWKGDTYMRIDSSVGLDSVPAGISEDEIDYSLLSTRALFERFCQEFQGGNAFEHSVMSLGGVEYIRLPMEYGAEFYLRKDYTANWRAEIKEKYLYWTQSEAKQAMEEAGFEGAEVHADMNDWILANRLKGKVTLFKMVDGELQEMEFPPTHMVAVGKKPKTGERQDFETDIDYKDTFSTIKYIEDEENDDEVVIKKVQIGETEFDVLPEPIKGTKKQIFRLRNEPGVVLKVVRADTVNDHSVFKSMFQAIGRESILDQMRVPYLKILDYDRDGPPYRYLLQEAAPSGAVPAADLIEKGKLTEDDVRQMANIINQFEKSKQWQLDTNPFSWYKVDKGDGATEMVYASGKVYKYDEDWEFKRVGLLQWLGKDYVEQRHDCMAAIPKKSDYEELCRTWEENEEGDTVKLWWKKYLNEEILPSLE